MSNEIKNWTAEQQRYIAWLALPKAERVPKTQQALANDLDVTSETLSRWKHLPGLMDAVNVLARELVKHDVAEVLGVIRREAKKANLPYVNMVLAMAGLGGDIEAAGKGPAAGLPIIREVVVNLNEPMEPDE